MFALGFVLALVVAFWLRSRPPLEGPAWWFCTAGMALIAALIAFPVAGLLLFVLAGHSDIAAALNVSEATVDTIIIIGTASVAGFAAGLVGTCRFGRSHLIALGAALVAGFGSWPFMRNAGTWALIPLALALVLTVAASRMLRPRESERPREPIPG